MAMKTVVALPGEGIGLYRDGRVLTPDQGGTAKTRATAQPFPGARC